MKTYLLAVGGAVALAVSLSAMAGPDWYVIEKGRAAKQAESHQPKSQQPMMNDHAAMMGNHVTMIQACREMMGKPN